MRPFLTTLAMIAVCLFAACDAESPAEPAFLPALPAAPDPQQFTSPVGAWRVTSLRGGAIPEGATPPSLTVEPDGTVFGFQGVNWYGGVLNPEGWDRGLFTYGSARATMRISKDPQANEVAARYSAALHEATTFTFRSGDLQLRNKDGDVIVTFEPADGLRDERPARPADITPVVERAAAATTPQGAWTLTSLRGEAPFTGARPPTLTIDADGRLSGSAQVNQYRTDMSPRLWLSGGFRIGMIEFTMAGSSREAMDAESRYFRALGEARAFAVRSGVLELSDEAGDVILRFEPAPP